MNIDICECGKKIIILTKGQKTVAFFNSFYHVNKKNKVGISVEDYNKLFGVRE